MSFPSDNLEELASLSYRQLQARAKIWQLPGNFKRSALLQLIRARSAGDETLVNCIISDETDARARRRSSQSVKRRPGRPRLTCPTPSYGGRRSNSSYDRGMHSMQDSELASPMMMSSSVASIEQLLQASNVPNASNKQHSMMPLFPVQRRHDNSQVRFSPYHKFPISQGHSSVYSPVPVNTLAGSGGMVSSNLMPGTPVDLTVSSDSLFPVMWSDKDTMVTSNNNNNYCQDGQWKNQESVWIPPLDYSATNEERMYEELVVGTSQSSDTVSANEDSCPSGTLQNSNPQSPMAVKQEYSCSTEMQNNFPFDHQSSQLQFMDDCKQTFIGREEIVQSHTQLIENANVITEVVDQQDWTYYSSTTVSNFETDPLPSFSSFLPHLSSHQQSSTAIAVQSSLSLNCSQFHS